MNDVAPGWPAMTNTMNPPWSSQRPRCRVHPKLCARLILFAAALLYATTITITIRNHASNVSTRHPPSRPNPMVAVNVDGNSTDDSIARYLVQKWNLTSPHAPSLLLRQFSLQISYDPQSDFLHFHHIPKTGGTSLSDILQQIFGPAVLPGSRRSEPFHAPDLESFLLSPTNGTSPDYKASYGHTRLRPIHGPNRTRFSVLLRRYDAKLSRPKRMRSLAMLRDPTDLRASTHAMAMCALNGKVNAFNYRRQTRNQTRACTAEEGLDLRRLVEDYHAEVLAKKCPASAGDDPTDLSRLNKMERRICTRGPEAVSHCLSPAHLLSSHMYSGMRSMYKSLLGRYFAEQEMGRVDYFGVEKLIPERRRSRRRVEGDTERTSWGMEPIEEYALVDLGGLDRVRRHPYDIEGFLETYEARPIDDPSTYEPDVLWFGITERMKESTCLLFYTLRVPPVPVPKARVVDCSPAAWWSARDREEVRKREKGDYALWRAANAILDVRVIKMKREVRKKLKSGGLERDEKERLDALAAAGCLEFDILRT
ncbi:hypothetical protein ACHAW6_010320 [Cyclotella cf. meneghiniana]